MFSNSTKYAIRAILYLSSLDVGKKSTVDDVAAELDLPKPYLSKLLQQLSRNTIIESSRGRGGGFFLSEKNLKRPLMDVIICLEGQNILKNCLLGLPNCSDSFSATAFDMRCPSGLTFMLKGSKIGYPAKSNTGCDIVEAEVVIRTIRKRNSKLNWIFVLKTRRFILKIHWLRSSKTYLFTFLANK